MPLSLGGSLGFFSIVLNQANQNGEAEFRAIDAVGARAITSFLNFELPHLMAEEGVMNEKAQAKQGLLLANWLILTLQAC